MTETAGKPLAYDLYVAADLFLKTGRHEAEVLARLGLTRARWNALAKAYVYLPLDDRYMAGIQALWPDVAPGEVAAALIGPRWQYPDPQPGPSAAARGIRAAVLTKPQIGPFAGLDRTAVYIVAHPEGTLVFYSHDGTRVFFDGRALTDRDGTMLDLDAPAFRHLGGRWYTDGRRILGQGQKGQSGGPVFWWTLEGADAATFHALNLRYAKDASKVWYITGKLIRTGNPAAFAIVPSLKFDWRAGVIESIDDNSLTARDDHRVYSYGVPVRGADPVHFRSLGEGYWTDDRHVWIDDGKLLMQADAATFLVRTPRDPPVDHLAGDATDHATPYRDGRPVSPDSAYESWSAFFLARDDREAWWWARVRQAREKG